VSGKSASLGIVGRDRITTTKVAASLGVPVIMIPDHETADETIAAHGWLRLRKPFTVQSLEDTIAKQSDSNQIATYDCGGGDRGLSVQQPPTARP